jgi:hypothetical protein
MTSSTATGPLVLTWPATPSTATRLRLGSLALALAAMAATGVSATGVSPVSGPAAGAEAAGAPGDPGTPPGRGWIAPTVGGAALAVGAAVAGGSAWQVPAALFGALGDGVHDDTAALQRALDTLPAGSTLQLRDGGTYLHSAILTVGTRDLSIEGTGATLVATREEASALHVAATGVTVTGLTLTTPTTTKRWDGFEQTKVWISADDAVLRDVHVVGSAAAGIGINDGAGGFLLDHVTVTDSRADGIHITGRAHDGRVVSPVTTGTGDDGVAVVSYMKDGGPCERVTVESPTVNGTTWGRGVSVVGGNDITYTDVAVHDTDAAGVYVGSEGDPYFTYASVGVLVDGGTVTGANTNAEKDHGAVLVYAGSSGTTTSDVTVRGLTISGTRTSSPWDAGVLADPGAQLERIDLSDLAISAGAKEPFWTNEPAQVRTSGLTDDDAAVPDQSGW